MAGAVDEMAAEHHGARAFLHRLEQLLGFKQSPVRYPFAQLFYHQAIHGPA